MEWNCGAARAKRVSLRDEIAPGFYILASRTPRGTESSNEIEIRAELSGGWGRDPHAEGVAVPIVPGIPDMRVTALDPTLRAPTGWNAFQFCSCRPGARASNI